MHLARSICAGDFLYSCVMWMYEQYLSIQTIKTHKSYIYVNWQTL